MLDNASWVDKLADIERQLLIEADFLLQREKNIPANTHVVDYGFLVYPAAKAFEGFLKTFFFRNGLISIEMYRSDHFRIGKALNPDLPYKYREDGWVWDDLARLYGEDLPARLWSTWRKCRNSVFHFKPDKLRLYTLVEAQIKIELIFSSIELSIERETHMGIHVKKTNNLSYNTNQNKQVKGNYL